ncbi:MAG: hypothetical protein R3B84_04145 [Zavarzinella sp.]
MTMSSTIEYCIFVVIIFGIIATILKPQWTGIWWGIAIYATGIIYYFLFPLFSPENYLPVLDFLASVFLISHGALIWFASASHRLQKCPEKEFRLTRLAGIMSVTAIIGTFLSTFAIHEPEYAVSRSENVENVRLYTFGISIIHRSGKPGQVENKVRLYYENRILPYLIGGSFMVGTVIGWQWFRMTANWHRELFVLREKHRKKENHNVAVIQPNTNCGNGLRS